MQEFIYISPSIFISDADNETVAMAGPMPYAGEVDSVMYWTGGAIGASVGIDLIDGGDDGSGSDVIDSSDDNLNGYDLNTGVAYGFDSGTVLKVTVDDITAQDIVVCAMVKLWLPYVGD